MSEQIQNYVELKGINKYFGKFKASDDINFGIEKGKLAALLGPSGSGKTTILRMIAGLEAVDSGEIWIDGKIVNDEPASKRGIGFVFQNYALFRYMTVYDNIAFGLSVNHWKKENIRNRVQELIELVGLQGMEKRYPNQLSGGQRQRVAFARALAPNPELLLLDEPFAAIDAKVRQELRSWLREMINKVGITSIFVTHDQDEAIEVADEILITNHGRLEQQGTPQEIYQQPKTNFVAEFMGHPICVEQINRFKGFEDLEDERRAVIRPENVVVNRIRNRSKLPATVEQGIVKRVVFRGKELEIQVEVHGIQLLTYRGIERDMVIEGEKVFVFICQAYTYGADGIIEIVGNKNKLEEYMVI